LAINNGFNTVLFADLQRAEVVALPLALILLLVVFGAVVAALIPLGTGLLAVMSGIAGMFLLSHITSVSVYAQNVVTLIGLGVAIDYSLFVTSRFREELKRGRGREEPSDRGARPRRCVHPPRGITVPAPASRVERRPNAADARGGARRVRQAALRLSRRGAEPHPGDRLVRHRQSAGSNARTPAAGAQRPAREAFGRRSGPKRVLDRPAPVRRSGARPRDDLFVASRAAAGTAPGRAAADRWAAQ